MCERAPQVGRSRSFRRCEHGDRVFGGGKNARAGRRGRQVLRQRHQPCKSSRPQARAERRGRRVRAPAFARVRTVHRIDTHGRGRDVRAQCPRLGPGRRRAAAPPGHADVWGVRTLRADHRVHRSAGRDARDGTDGGLREEQHG